MHLARLGPVIDADQSGLEVDGRIARLFHRHDIARQILAALRDRQHAAPKPIEKIDLLDGIDPQVAGEPEAVDAAADVPVAVIEQVHVFLHPLLADAPRDLLIDRHRRRRDRRAQRMVPVPAGKRAHHAVPLEDVLVRIGDHAGLQRDERVRHLVGGGRQHRLAGAFGIAGDDEILIRLVGHEGAGGALVGKALGEAFANLAARRRDMGAREARQGDGSGNAGERMTASEHRMAPFQFTRALSTASWSNDGWPLGAFPILNENICGKTMRAPSPIGRELG